MRKLLIAVDITIVISTIFLLGVFRPDIVMIGVYLLLIPYLILTHRKYLLKHFVVASVLAFFWLLITNGEYDYGRNLIAVFNIDLYPLLAWSVGLLTVSAIYRQCFFSQSNRGFLTRLLVFSVFYWMMLIAVEMFGYNIIELQFTSSYPGLPLCNCLHVPLWMKWGYFTIGPVFFTISYLLGLERPCVKKVI